MQALMFKMIVEVLLRFLSEELLKELADDLLDSLENKIETSENKFDDAVILPIVKRIRETFDIPDGDD